MRQNHPESMSRKQELSASMSLRQFNHGYWYATELKLFADALGIQSTARLRKDELERAIKEFLRTGAIGQAARNPKPPIRSQPRDVDLGLHLNRRIIRYTNDPTTKAFLEREARKLVPTFRRRSGAMYRLNRWREEQLARGIALTYRALVGEYVRLSQSSEPFAHIPHGRYVNFLSDFMARQAGATKAKALSAWHELKTMDCPKTYRAWSSRRTS
jgi:hypothetical protein